MLVKIIIIIAAIAIGVFIFSEEITSLFPQTTQITNSMKNDISLIQKNTMKDVEEKIDFTINETGNKIEVIKNSSKTIISDKIEKNNPLPKISQDISTTIKNSTSSIVNILPKP